MPISTDAELRIFANAKIAQEMAGCKFAPDDRVVPLFSNSKGDMQVDERVWIIDSQGDRSKVWNIKRERPVEELVEEGSYLKAFLARIGIPTRISRTIEEEYLVRMKYLASETFAETGGEF